MFYDFYVVIVLFSEWEIINIDIIKSYGWMEVEVVRICDNLDFSCYLCCFKLLLLYI